MPLDRGALVIAGFSPQIADLVQARTWERKFYDALFPILSFRADCSPSEFPGNLGARMAMTRTGLIPVSTTPISATGQDPNDMVPGTYPSEQWEVTAAQYGTTIDTNMLTSAFALANQFHENAQKLGLNAGQTMNHLCRNQMYLAYLGGQTQVDVSQGGASNALHVAQCAGFLTNVPVANNQAIPAAVSAQNPIPAVLFAGSSDAQSLNVIGCAPDDANNPYGPGTLTLSVNSSKAVTAGDTIVALNSSTRIRVGGAYNDDAVGAADTAQFKDFITAQAILRQNNVPPHQDGFYHSHVAPATEAELFMDSNFQRSLTALPDSFYWKKLAIGQMAGMVFIRNTEVPTVQTIFPTELFPYSGATSAGAVSPNLPLFRDIVTGQGVCYEKFVDEMKMYISEAGVTGKVGKPVIVNNGVQVNVDRVRLTLRAPLDRRQQFVSSTWTWTGDFPIPSDITTPFLQANGANIRYKRGLVIIHA